MTREHAWERDPHHDRSGRPCREMVLIINGIIDPLGDGGRAEARLTRPELMTFHSFL